MKTLLILRHAKSSWDDPALADHDRPLNKRGRRDAPRMGALLREQDLVPDIILSSTAKRARATAEIVGEAAGYSGPISLTSKLYLAASEEYIAMLCSLPAEIETVMVVGHNPGLEELLEDVTGLAEHLPTAGLARVALPITDWPELSTGVEGELKALWVPKELG